MTDILLSPEELKAMRERESKASLGPWQQTHDVKLGVKIWPREGMPLFIVAGGVPYSRITPDDPVPQWQKDAAFVRHARTDIPRLLDSITALQQEVERLKADRLLLARGWHWEWRVIPEDGTARETYRDACALRDRILSTPEETKQ